MGTSQKIPDQYALNIFALARWHKTIRPGMEQRFPYRKDIHKRCLQQRYAGSRSRNLCWVYRILRVPTWSDLHNKPSRPSVQIQRFFFVFVKVISVKAGWLIRNGYILRWFMTRFAYEQKARLSIYGFVLELSNIFDESAVA